MSNHIGWELELKSGKIMREGKVEWKEVPKRDITRLSLFHYGGKRWDLSGKQAYFVRNTVSVIPGISDSVRIEKRCIGYYEGNKKVCYIVDEFTGRLDIKVEEN
jgi:hypothetical protein